MLVDHVIGRSWFLDSLIAPDEFYKTVQVRGGSSDTNAGRPHVPERALVRLSGSLRTQARTTPRET